MRVLDLSTSVAGPYAAMLLGDMGADILKIERPYIGDDARAWGPPFLDGESLWYISVNRNKRSITLDYSKPQGREVLAALIMASDVIVVNQPAQVQEKLCVDAASCHGLHSRIIHVSITGFGVRGERSGLTCYDLIAEGYSGIMDITGDADGPPQKIGAPAADMLAGSDAAFATVAALFDCSRTGNGHVIDISLVESMTRFLACRIVPYLGSQELPRRSGGKDSVIAVYQIFETADLPMTLGLGSDRIWERFWSAIGMPDVSRRSRYNSNAKRREHRAEIIKLIQKVLLTKPRDHWLTLLGRVRVPAGPIYRVDEVAADRAFHDRGLLYILEADGRQVPQVGTGFQVDGQANVPRMSPPKLGASTVEILRDIIKLSDADIAMLRKSRII
ncbi:CaiB/BaiF CoA transferase family protein [Pseudorhodoplanes sp.]|uniref:CaiB/BaiF CoA transferase family protein n=1 Tax=Pseudorhodoplanes sp. TaxID=1934341 RepID=UPI003D0EE71A